jgi:hypothetical protein
MVHTVKRDRHANNRISSTRKGVNLMKENLTSQLVQAEYIAGKNIMECGSSSSPKRDYH